MPDAYLPRLMSGRGLYIIARNGLLRVRILWTLMQPSTVYTYHYTFGHLRIVVWQEQNDGC